MIFYSKKHDSVFSSGDNFNSYEKTTKYGEYSLDIHRGKLAKFLKFSFGISPVNANQPEPGPLSIE